MGALLNLKSLFRPHHLSSLAVGVFLGAFAFFNTNWGTPTAQAAQLPESNWRAIPAQVASISNVQDLQPLMQGENATLKIDGAIQNGEVWWAIRIPKQPQGKRWMMVFSGIYAESQASMVMAKAPPMPNNAIPRTNQFKTLEQKPITASSNSQQFTFVPEPDTWVQFRLVPPQGGKLPIPFQLFHLALYAFEEDKPQIDYWLVVGASLELQAFEAPTSWSDTILEQYGRDPVHFTLAKSGWTSADILAALPAFLAAHPYATSVLLDVGGNDVTRYKPFPGGKDRLQQDTINIVEQIIASGKQPILSRITFRAYKQPNAMLDESQGSLPYNVAIHDPIIKQKMPAFYHEQQSRGRIDAYSYFKQNPQYLTDEIHFTKEGANVFRQLWAEQAASVIYQTLPLCVSTQSCLLPVTLSNAPDHAIQTTGKAGMDNKKLNESINGCSNSGSHGWLLLGLFLAHQAWRTRRAPIRQGM